MANDYAFQSTIKAFRTRWDRSHSQYQTNKQISIGLHLYLALLLHHLLQLPTPPPLPRRNQIHQLRTEKIIDLLSKDLPQSASHLLDPLPLSLSLFLSPLPFRFPWLRYRLPGCIYEQAEWPRTKSKSYLGSHELKSKEHHDNHERTKLEELPILSITWLQDKLLLVSNLEASSFCLLEKGR